MNPIAAAIAAVAALITKSIPSDKVKLQWMMDHHPWIYYRVRKHVLVNAFRYIKHHSKYPDVALIQSYIDLTCAQFSVEERTDMVTILIKELKK